MIAVGYGRSIYQNYDVAVIDAKNHSINLVCYTYQILILEINTAVKKKNITLLLLIFSIV